MLIRIINLTCKFISFKANPNFKQQPYTFAANDQAIYFQPKKSVLQSHQIVQLEPSALQVNYTDNHK